MSGQYILGGEDGHTPIPEPDLIAWGKWFRAAKTGLVVAKTQLGDAKVSTVFLGLDHGFDPTRPLLFETLVFGGPHDQDCERYSTWAEAEAGHAKMVAKVGGGE